jgi:DNA-binding transcriptional MerR regulator
MSLPVNAPGMNEPGTHGQGDDEGSESGRRLVKSATAFRTISEVSDELDVPQHVLRFWETKFPQIRPLKRGGGRRYYRPEDVELLRRVCQLLYHEGYTIKGVQRLLREGQIKASRPPPVEAILPLGLDELDPEPAVEEVIDEPEQPAPPRRRRSIGEEATRAVLSDLLDELAELRELLAGRS